MASEKTYLDFLSDIAAEDVSGIITAEAQYGASWKKRGGAGAYMVMVRKFDRLEQAMPKFNYDIFDAVVQDPRSEGVLDDIRDARRYLYLIEAEIRARGINPAHRDNSSNATITKTVPYAPPPNVEFIPVRDPKVPLTDPTDGRSRVKPKYRDPDTGHTWSGRGQLPVWMREKIQNDGAKKEDFLIPEGEDAAPPVVMSVEIPEHVVDLDDVQITITSSSDLEVLTNDTDTPVSTDEPVEADSDIPELDAGEESRD